MKIRLNGRYAKAKDPPPPGDDKGMTKEKRGAYMDKCRALDVPFTVAPQYTNTTAMQHSPISEHTLLETKSKLTLACTLDVC